MKNKAYKTGKSFSAPFEVQIEQNKQGMWYGCVDIGMQYYQTGPYKDKTCVMSELKGYLEGLMVQMQASLKHFDEELKKER